MNTYRVRWTGTLAYELIVEETSPEKAIAWVRKQHALLLDLLVRHGGADSTTFTQEGHYVVTRGR